MFLAAWSGVPLLPLVWASRDTPGWVLLGLGVFKDFKELGRLDCWAPVGVRGYWLRGQVPRPWEAGVSCPRWGLLVNREE